MLKLLVLGSNCLFGGKISVFVLLRQAAQHFNSLTWLYIFALGWFTVNYRHGRHSFIFPLPFLSFNRIDLPGASARVAAPLPRLPVQNSLMMMPNSYHLTTQTNLP